MVAAEANVRRARFDRIEFQRGVLVGRGIGKHDHVVPGGHLGVLDRQLVVAVDCHSRQREPLNRLGQRGAKPIVLAAGVAVADDQDEDE